MIARSTLISITLLLTATPSAQGEVVGSMDDWDQGAADIIIIQREPVAIGSISEDGTIELALPAKFTPTQPFGQIFSCSAGTVQITNPEATYVATPNSLVIADLAAKKMLAPLTPADSEETARAAPDMFTGDTPTGTLYQWMYFSAPAALDGECVTATTYETESGASISRRVVYDAEFDAGWNLMAVEIAEVAKPVSMDRTIATLTRYRTIEALPEDTVWVYGTR
ncbi:hypothetical protein [Lentisalinibacter sediminis]|uniref:hypothetical protein n=1 Tax=Lentisalinibacter sediminis TaxID=2992237 RepID=UPI00386C2529